MQIFFPRGVRRNRPACGVEHGPAVQPRLWQNRWSLLGTMIFLGVFSSLSIAQDKATGTNEASKPNNDLLNNFRIVSIENVIALGDKGENAKARDRLAKHLANYPDDAQAYGQQARLAMRSGFIADDSLLGFHYSRQSDAAATAALEKSLMLAPGNAEEISRWGHLHAVQGRYDEAEAAFREVRTNTSLPPWLLYNEAIAQAGRGDYEQAAQSLEEITEKLPRQNGTVRMNIYRSSWKLRAAIASVEPSTDPVEAVRGGYAKRITMDGVYETALATVDSEKPLIIMLNSSDGGCGYCTQNFPRIIPFIKKLSQDFDFAYASVEPWKEINKYRVMRGVLNVSGVPSTIVVYKGQHIVTAEGGVNEIEVDGYRSLSKGLQSGEHSGKPMESFDTEVQKHIERSLDTHLSDGEGIKAAAYAKDGKFWLSGIVDKQPSQAVANSKALEECFAKLADSAVRGECVLHHSR